MKMPNVIVFKLLDTLMFKSLIEEIILKHKIHSPRGPKQISFYFALSVMVFTI